MSTAACTWIDAEAAAILVDYRACLEAFFEPLRVRGKRTRISIFK
jgi:hypothetical protein